MNYFAVVFMLLFVSFLNLTNAQESKNVTVLDMQKTEIRKVLFKNYNNKVRPTDFNNLTMGVKVDVVIAPFYIQDIDESKGSAQVYYYVDLQFNDSRLVWPNKTLETMFPSGCVFLELQDLWIPPVRFAEALNQRTDLEPKFPVKLCSAGDLYLYYKAWVEGSEVFHTEKFPYDTQKIHSYFQHTGQAGVEEVDIRSVDPGPMFPEGLTTVEWEFLNFSCETLRRELLGDVADRRPSFTAVIRCITFVRRRPDYYLINFGIPSFIVATMSVVGVHSHQKATSVAKFQVALTSMVAVSVMILSIVHEMPHSGDVSYMQIYFFWLWGVVLSSTLSVWLIGIADSNKKWKISRPTFLNVVSLALHLLLLLSSIIWFTWF